LEYERYCVAEVDHYIASNQAEFEAITAAKLAEERKPGGSFSWAKTSEMTAKWAAQSTIQRKLALLSFEEFLERKKQGSGFSMKPVAVSPAPDPTPIAHAAPEPSPASGEAPASAFSESEKANEEPKGNRRECPVIDRESAIEPRTNPATEPAMPESLMIELASEPPPNPTAIPSARTWFDLRSEVNKGRVLWSILRPSNEEQKPVPAQRSVIMKRVLEMIFAMLAIVAIALGADNTLGSWKYNAGKSKAAPGASPITSLTVTREAADGGAKISAKGEGADGSKIDNSYTPKYDGKEVAVTGTGLTWDTVAIKQVSANTLTEERSKKGGKYHSTVRDGVSKDGKTMTATTRGTDADGKAFTAVAVFDKQ
jgi:hypothetical protein